MSKLSEWLKRNDLKKKANAELDRRKPDLYALVDKLADEVAQEVTSERRVSLHRDYLLDKVRQAMRPLVGGNVLVLAALEIALQAAGGALESAATGKAEELAANVRKEADRLKQRIKSARL